MRDATSVSRKVARLTSQPAWEVQWWGWREEGTTWITSRTNDAPLASQSLGERQRSCFPNGVSSNSRIVMSEVFKLGDLVWCVLKEVRISRQLTQCSRTNLNLVSVSDFQGEDEGILTVARPGKYQPPRHIARQRSTVEIVVGRLTPFSLSPSVFLRPGCSLAVVRAPSLFPKVKSALTVWRVSPLVFWRVSRCRRFHPGLVSVPGHGAVRHGSCWRHCSGPHRVRYLPPHPTFEFKLARKTAEI